MGMCTCTMLGKEGPCSRSLRGSQDVPCANGAASMAGGNVVRACGHFKEGVRNGNGIPCMGNSGR